MLSLIIPYIEKTARSTIKSVIIQPKLNRPQFFLIQLLIFQYLMLIPLDGKYLQNRILEIVAIVSIGGDKLFETLVAAVLCSGILAPSAPDTALLTAGGADIMFACFSICNEIHPGHSRQLFFPFFVGRFIVDDFVESLKGK